MAAARSGDRADTGVGRSHDATAARSPAGTAVADDLADAAARYGGSEPGTAADPARVRQRSDAAALRPDQQGRAQLRRRHRQRDLRADRQRQLEHPRRAALQPGLRRLALRERQRDRVRAVLDRQHQHHPPVAGRRELGLHQQQHPQDRLHAGARPLRQVLARPGQHGDRRRLRDGPLGHHGHRLFQRRRQRLGADHPLQRPGPRLRREPERHHHRQRLHQLRRPAPGAHPLRHARNSTASPSRPPTAATC